MKKLLLIIFFILSLNFSVFGAITINIGPALGSSGFDARCFSSSNSTLSFGAPFSNIGSSFTCNTDSILLYSPSNSNSLFQIYNQSQTITSFNNKYNFDNYKYLGGERQCKVSLECFYNYCSLSSNLVDPFSEFQHYVINQVEPILENNYYMKTKLYAKITKKNNPLIFEIIYPHSVSPGSLVNAKDVQASYNFNIYEKKNSLRNKCLGLNGEEANSNYCGVYEIKYYAEIDDLKCDFDQDSSLSSNFEVQNSYFQGESFSILPSFSISPSSFDFENSSISTNSSIVISFQSETEYLTQGASTPFSFSSLGIESCYLGDYEVSLGDNMQASFTYPGLFSFNQTLTLSCYDETGNQVNIVDPNLFFYLQDSDEDNIPNEFDLCPDEEGESFFQGCAFEYSSIGECFNSNFEEDVFSCNFNSIFNICRDRINFNSESSSLVDSLFSSISNNIKPSQGSGYYICEDRGGFMCSSSTSVGYCELRHNAAYTCSLNSRIFYGTKLGKPYDFYRSPQILESESSNFQTFLCWENGWDMGSIPSSDYKYASPKVLRGSFYNNIIRVNNTDKFIKNDTYTRNKFECDLNLKQCYYYDLNGRNLNPSINFNDSSFQNSNSGGFINIYKDGIFDRTEKIELENIALYSHVIRKSRDQNSAIDFVNNSYSLMSKFNITKNLNFNTTTFRTLVQITLEDIPVSERKNLTIYQVLPKTISFSDINIINSGGGRFFVVDKNPVIGWYFNESPTSPTIEYEIPGGGEGGAIIVVQEPILFNQGDLIINYREGGCNAGEAHVFDIDSLEGSIVKETQSSGVYSICIAHVSLPIYRDSSGSLDFDLFTYQDLGNVSLSNILPETLTLSVNNATPIYWDMIISSQNPKNGTYSCLGSIELTSQTSLFGDCGWTQNRIWLSLSGDVIPPVVNITYPFLAHTLDMTINVSDVMPGSGLKEAFYCFYEKISGGPSTCVPNIAINITDPFSFSTENFRLTCSQDWGCTNVVRVRACDNDNNCMFHEEDFLLIDKGSSCQADCIAKPSPNRYLKECRNLNSCEFFPAPFETGNNRGLYVSELCNLKVSGSWVSYNLTHEILCPMGPFREARFSASDIYLGNSDCTFLKVTPSTAIIDGEQLIMNVVSCYDTN